MLFIILYLLWVLLNGRITGEILLLGLPVAGAIYGLSLRMLDISLKRDWSRLRRLPALLAYLCFLLKEVLLSALHVVRLIWSPALPQSTLAECHPPVHSDSVRVLLADSITLTPGTITLEMEGDRFLVHCLNREDASGLENSAMFRQIQKLEGP